MTSVTSRNNWGAKKGRGWYTVPMSERTAFIVHYNGGTPLRLASKGHAACAAQVRSDQSFHLNGRGWSDIGYNFLVCPHGVAFEGRGWRGVGAHCPGFNRSGIGVQNMIGGNETPTPEALATIRALYDDACRMSGRKLRKMGHRDGFSTSCPGDKLEAWVKGGMKVKGGAASKPSKPSKPGQLDVDGIWGRNTTKAMQRWVGATPDGIWGPDSKRKLEKKLRAWMIARKWPKAPIRVDGKISRRDIRVLQKLVGVTADGYWGPQTTRGVQRHLNKINSK